MKSETNNFFRPKQKGHPNQLGCPFLCLKGVREGNPSSARTCAILSMSTSDSELPRARIDSGGTPPAGKDASLFPSFLSCAAPIRARSRLFEKRRPKNFYARFARPTPCAHVRYSLAQARRSAAAPRRELPGVASPLVGFADLRPLYFATDGLGSSSTYSITRGYL